MVRRDLHHGLLVLLLLACASATEPARAAPPSVTDETNVIASVRILDEDPHKDITALSGPAEVWFDGARRR